MLLIGPPARRSRLAEPPSRPAQPAAVRRHRAVLPSRRHCPPLPVLRLQSRAPGRRQHVLLVPVDPGRLQARGADGDGMAASITAKPDPRRWWTTGRPCWPPSRSSRRASTCSRTWPCCCCSGARPWRTAPSHFACRSRLLGCRGFGEVVQLFQHMPLDLEALAIDAFNLAREVYAGLRM